MLTCKGLQCAIPTKYLYHRIRLRNPDNYTPNTNNGIRKLRQIFRGVHYKQNSWVRELELTWSLRTTCRWNSTVKELLYVELPKLHTLKISTSRPLACEEVRCINSHSIRRRIIEAIGFITFVRLLESDWDVPELRNLIIDDPSFTAAQTAKLYSLPNVSQLRVSWGNETNMESTRDSTFLSEELVGVDTPSSKLTKLELLRSLLPAGLPVTYILKKHPNLKELGWIVRDVGDEVSSTRRQFPWVPLADGLRHLQKILFKLELPSFNTLTLVYSKGSMNFSDFSVLRTLKIHATMILPFSQQEDMKETVAT